MRQIEIWYIYHRFHQAESQTSQGLTTLVFPPTTTQEHTQLEP